MDVLTLLIQILSVVIAVIGLLMFQKLSKTMQVFAIYLVIAASVELVSYSFAMNDRPNLYMFHAFTVLEFWFTSIFFYNIIPILRSKISLGFVLALGITLFIAITLFIQSINVFNSYTSSFVSGTILLLCLLYFFSIIEERNDSTESKTINWFVIGLFFYHCVSLAIFIFSNHLTGYSKDTQLMVWGLRALFILAAKLIFLFALCYYAYHYIKQVTVGKILP